ncbi:MAG: hypothetical protein HOG49_18330 [Candidatus Scalindua sp.]|jgi:uracil-DNA glycosylase family 4|nr:hypothetical protein [Candidatus Scalindua sp.]
MHETCEKCKRGKTETLNGVGNVLNPDVIVVEEQPVNHSRLSRELTKAGFSQDKIFYTSIVKCRAPKKGKIEPKITDRQIKLCSEFLQADIKDMKPKLMILMGGASSKAILKKTGGVNKFRGNNIPFHEKSCNVVVTYNQEQSQVRHLQPVFERDLKFAKSTGMRRYRFDHDYREDNKTLDSEDAIDLMDMIVDEKKDFALDWETYPLKPFNKGAQLISCGIALSHKESYSFLVEDPDSIMDGRLKYHLKQLLESECVKIFHNYKFERMWAKQRLGIDIKNKIIDTQYLAYIKNETNRTHNLGHLSFVNFGLEKIKEADKYIEDMRKCPTDLLMKYNGLDTKLTYKLRDHYTPLLDDKDHAVHTMLIDGAEATLKAEMAGALIDQKVLINNKKRVGAERYKEMALLRDMQVVKDFEEDKGQEINLNAWQQTNKILFKHLKLKSIKKTPSGVNDSGDVEVLEHYGDVPFCEHLLKYRKLNKLHSTYLVGAEKAIYDDGLIHTNYNLHFTETGRLSSDSPNLQNFPKHDNAFVREMFIVPENHYLMSFDYSGAEVRCMAMESRDRELIRQINAKYDMHQFWADRLSKITGTEVSRFSAKNGFVFPSFYGAGFKSIARNLELDQDDMQQAQNELFKMYPSIKNWQKQLEQFYNKHHYVESLLGRRRHAPLDYNQMINTPVQSLASDLCLLSMIEASREGYKIPLIIHDDITLYVHKDDVLKTYKRIKKIMTRWDYDFINVDLEIECLIGTNWFNQKELQLRKKVV